MHYYNRLLATLFVAWLAAQPFCSVSQATTPVQAVVADDDDDDADDASLRMPVRRQSSERHTEAAAGWVSRLKSDKKEAEQERKNAGKMTDAEVASEREERYRRLAAEKTGQRYLTPEERAERDRREKAVLDSLLAIDYTVPDLSQYKRLEWHNDPIAESTSELAEQMARDTLNGGDLLYHAKTVSIDTLNNDLFFYFVMHNGRPDPLRLRGQYCADDPLGIEKVSFIVNGYTYEFSPDSVRMGRSGARLYWECFDCKLSPADKDLVYALSHGRWARLVFIGGRGFNHVRDLTQEQIQDFYRTFALYRKMGGTL